MVCLTSISASRSTSPGGVRSSQNATKVQAPKKSTETTWTVRPSIQARNLPNLSLSHFSTLKALWPCSWTAATFSFASLLLLLCPSCITLCLTFFCIILHLPRSHAALVSSFLSFSQVTAMTTGPGCGEDIKWSLTSRLVRPPQPVLWLSCSANTVTHIILHRLRAQSLILCNQINPSPPSSWRYLF